MKQVVNRHKLDKSRFVEGTICEKRLWLRYHRPNLAMPPSVADERTMAEGTTVGVQARNTLYPDGVLVQGFGLDAVQETQDLLKTNPAAIFEATFFYEGVLVMVDILANNYDGTWDILEVKASTRSKPEHLDDVAIQSYVLFGSGIELRRQKLVLINKSHAIEPTYANLFTERDVTEEVAARLERTSAKATRFHHLLECTEEPQVAIGNHCRNPNPCPFKDYCWQDVPEPSIFSIPRLQGKQKTALAAQGILQLKDLPPDLALTQNQQTAVRLMMNQSEEIDWGTIKEKLQTLVYPIYFFDFETDAPAIPQHSGLKPYSPVPFQYSCHILYEDGSLGHAEYLHEDQSDPRRHLLKSLLGHIGPIGSVVVYNASFERGVLRNLIHMAPEHAAELQSMIDRLWDQLEIFKHHYKSYRFGGSNSIKKILPVVAPHLTYNDLTVARGDEAQAVWNQMIKTPESPEKQKMIDDLLAYCKLDTLAMVEIQCHLEGLCALELA